MSDPADIRPDLTAGVPATTIVDRSPIAGRVGDDEVVLVRTGDRFFAVGAHCTHYRGALADGLVVGDTIRCPLHHACFSLETGEALRAPALDPIGCWRVEQRDGQVFVREKAQRPPLAAMRRTQNPSSVVIVGGGAAGLAAADMLRREGYSNPVAIISADADPPVDRPNLSKDYLAGEAQDDWIPLWPADWYSERRVELLLNSRVSSIDTTGRTFTLENGSRREFGTILIATGADPVHLPVPGNNAARVFYLLSFADSRAIVERARDAKR
ncbi:MAG TPA: FAD-dependent oxidoreductase, partial [Vicinamibacterales bacterium]